MHRHHSTQLRPRTSLRASALFHGARAIDGVSESYSRARVQAFSDAIHTVPFDDCQLWSGLLEFSPNLTYEEFKAVILKLYPGATEEQTFTFADNDRVTSKQLRLGIQSKEELVVYHQQFLAITQYLISCNRLSANEQGRAFLQGFRSDVLQRIYQRLQIKFPDHFPDDLYTLAQIMDAASFIFAQQSVSFEPTQTSSATAPVHMPTAVRTTDLSSMFENLAQMITASFIAVQQAPVQSPSQSPTLAQYQTELVAQYWNTIPSPPCSPLNKCNFCSEEGHFIAACMLVEQYIEDGMICRNSEG